jgi:hypothetical protein
VQQKSIIRIGLCLLVIMSGLAIRGFGPAIGVPVFITKYAGSALWGTMVYLLVGIMAPNRNRPEIAGIALVIAVAVELLRLYHTPALDAFRLTLAGALLLGRFFSLWNILAYAAGIVFGTAIDRGAPPPRWGLVWLRRRGTPDGPEMTQSAERSSFP